MATKLIALSQIRYQPEIQVSIDQYELMFFILQMQMHATIPPLLVKYDQPSGFYLVVCKGAVYTDEGFTLEGARKFGFNEVPCTVVGDDSAPDGDSPPTNPPAPQTPELDSPIQPTKQPDANSLRNQAFEQFESLIAGIAAAIIARSHPAIRRNLDPVDLTQEALIAVAKEIDRDGGMRLKDGKELRMYLYGVFRAQIASAWRVVRRAPLLPADAAPMVRSALEEIIENEFRNRLEKEIIIAEGILDQAQSDLRGVVASLPPAESVAVVTWLNGATLAIALEKSGLSLAVVRRVIEGLKTGNLAGILRSARQAVERIYQQSSGDAACLRLGLLSRLIADPME